MKPWRRIDDGTATVHTGYLAGVAKKFVKNSGDEFTAYVMSKEGTEAVVIIPLTPEYRVVIARQFRCGPELVLEDLPGGLVDPGEDHAKAAERELLEETGYASERLEYIGKAFVNPWSNAVHHYYIAHDCRKVTGALQLDEGEEIEVVEITIDRLINNARQARMTEAAGVLLAYEKLKKLEESTK